MVQQIFLQGTTPEALTQLINEGVKTQLQFFFKDLKLKEPNEYLSRNEVSKILGVNLSTLHGWKVKKILIPVGISGRVYYLRSEIEAKLIRLND
jgi:hypothetical protein